MANENKALLNHGDYIKMNIKHKNFKAGLPPGSLIFTGKTKTSHVEISTIQYSEEDFQMKQFPDIEKALSSISGYKGNVWVNITGLQDVSIIEKTCSFLGVHRLTTEDILSVNQRPKLEEYPDYLYIVFKMLAYDTEINTVDTEQVSIIKKENILITFQEKPEDVFDNIRTRIREGAGYVRKGKTDYLLYALMDSVVDHYFIVLEQASEKLDLLETGLLENPDKVLLKDLYLLRKQMINVRKSTYPLREVVGRLEKITDPIISSEIHVYFRDLYDHTIRVIESIEVFRDSSAGLLDLYMNSVSNKMNGIMKVLTIISTIFIPLTFIAGVYGMNFENMPELSWKYAYFSVLGAMLFISLTMLFLFKRKKWL